MAKVNTIFLNYRSFLLIIVMLFKSVGCKVYTVGDEQGWNSDFNFGSWANKYNFSVGDILGFKYVKGQHNVYEVMEATYRSCDTSSGVIAKYESGNDEVKLSLEKKYWFICSIEGHCLGGMRFSIQVNASNSTSTPPTIQPTPPSNNSSFSRHKHIFQGSTFSICLLALGISLQFLL